MWLTAGLIVYALAAAVILLTPLSYGAMIDGIDKWLRQDLGLTFFGAGWVEFTGNVLLFVPLGFFVTLFFSRPWVGAVLGMVISAGVEIVQIVIPHRHASLRDVISNTIGAAIGAFIAWLIVLRRRRRAERKAREWPEAVESPMNS
jgi:uncharacterized membrane protein YccC